MFGVILKITNSSFRTAIAFCRSIYVKNVMKLLAFIFEQSSYLCLRLTRPNYAFMRRRLYSKRKVK